jgi:hypothetical protein
MKVWQPGAVVVICPCLKDRIQATVLAACIRGNHVTYEVAWWDGNQRHSQ